MPSFLSQSLEQLTRQLSFTPPQRRRQQMDHAESLYWQIDPQRNYPLDFVTFRITGYRPDEAHDTTLVGAAVRRDLLLMVDQLSDTLDDRMADYDPRPVDQKTLADQLNVSTKTISRYRRDGLFARRLIWPDGRRRIGYLPASIDRFLEARGQKVKLAGQFNRIDETTRHQILMRARRITSRVEVSPFRVAEHLSKKFGRSTETLRQLLLAHDRNDPRVAIFPDHTPPLTEKQQRIIHRAYHRGIPVARLARRFDKSRTAIYRAINLRRAAAIRQLEIRYVMSPTFQRSDAEEVILASDLPDKDEQPPERRDTTPDAAALPLITQLTEQPLLDASQETALFVRCNYLKYRADTLRQSLDPHAPNSSKLDRIETYLRRAVTIRHRLVRSNMRLIVSVARKHLAGGKQPRTGQNLADLVSEGSVVLLEAIDTFDPARGNRFSTYLTWALMRRFAQSTSQMQKQTTAPLTDHDEEYWPASMNPSLSAMEQTEQITDTLSRLLDELDERERFIVMRHFGLSDQPGQAPRAEPLSEVARHLNISAERARQIEHRALQKLRRVAGRLGLSLPGGDLLSPPE